MRRTLRNGLIVLAGLIGIIYFLVDKLLTKVGLILAISPTVKGLKTLASILFDLLSPLLSHPFILIGVVVIIGAIATVLWRRVGDIEIESGSTVNKCRELLENNISYFDADDVRGSIEYEDVRWIGHRKRSGRTHIDPPACQYHGVKLVPKMKRFAKAYPNSPMIADEKTREYKDRAWENMNEREKVESEELIDVLACSYEDCPFSIPKDELTTSDENAVRTQFKNHIQRMRTGGSDPFVKWRTRAEERHEFEPTPSDLWDAYARECDDPAVIVNESRPDGIQLSGDSGITCEELEDHKRRADGINQLIEYLPTGFDIVFSFIFRSD